MFVIVVGVLVGFALGFLAGRAWAMEEPVIEKVEAAVEQDYDRFKRVVKDDVATVEATATKEVSAGLKLVQGGLSTGESEGLGTREGRAY